MRALMREEDLGRAGDITSELTVPAERRLLASLVARKPGTIAGLIAAQYAYELVDPTLRVTVEIPDGSQAAAGARLAVIEGSARSILTAERVSINFLQTLSSTSTATRRYVDAIATVPGARAKVVETRKTIPGLRLAQKYAVRVGGGRNQRLALWHGILIKENHIAAAGGIAAVMAQAHALNAGVDIQIEVESIDQLREALAAGATSVLLDNFALQDMREAVKVAAGRAILEVSGGVTLSALREIAATGVDRVSIGALTKDVVATDFSMRVLD